MSDRIALLEQRVADLEAECAGLAAVSAMLLHTVGEQLDIEPEQSAEIVSAVRKRWPDVSAEQIEKITHGLLLLWFSPGRRPHETN